MLILLPPSEGKAAPARGRPLDLAGLSHPALTAAREEVLEALTGLCSGDPQHAARTLGIGPTQTQEVRRNATLRTAPTARADRVYTGVLYEALDLASLDPASRRRATRWLLTTSSLFGLLGPADRIPSYRLAGGVTLPSLGPVAGHWRRVLDPEVCEALGSGLLIDLRSSTYAGFWRPDPDLARRVATVRVLQQVGTRRTVVSHFNKATKGRLVRGLLERGDTVRTIARLAELLRDHGWVVETPTPGRLDVVVEEV